MAPRHRNRECGITIVSNNLSTLADLGAYLRRAGVVTNGTRDIERVVEMLPLGASTVVVFPDDFRADVVNSALSVVRAQRPKALTVLVTATPTRFTDEGASSLVLPKPAWGWTILDAIRAHLEPASSR